LNDTFFFSAPQLKRDPLGGGVTNNERRGQSARLLSQARDDTAPDSRDRLRHPGFLLGTQDGGVVAFRLGRLVEPGFRSRERRGALGVQSSPRQTRGASA